MCHFRQTGQESNQKIVTHAYMWACMYAHTAQIAATGQDQRSNGQRNCQDEKYAHFATKTAHMVQRALASLPVSFKSHERKMGQGYRNPQSDQQVYPFTQTTRGGTSNSHRQQGKAQACKLNKSQLALETSHSTRNYYATARTGVLCMFTACGDVRSASAVTLTGGNGKNTRSTWNMGLYRNKHAT